MAFYILLMKSPEGDFFYFLDGRQDIERPIPLKLKVRKTEGIRIMLKFQKIIEGHAGGIMVLCGTLIASGFFGQLMGWKNLRGSTMFIASLIGFIPVVLHAFQAVRARQLSIEVLVSLAVLGALAIGEYEESAMVTFLFALGGFLEKKTLEKTRASIKSLTQMAPTVALQASGKEVEIEAVELGMVLLVKTGAQVPVDGAVTDGKGFVNEASITGEAKHVKKAIGDKVFAGSILEDGTLYVSAQKIGEETTFGKIIELVEEAQDAKSPAEKFIDRFAKFYTPFVLLLSLILLFWSQDLKLAITLLVLGCPGALVIGAPVSNVAAIGNGAKNGVLIKGGEVMNTFHQVDTLLLDKTGTLTKGNTQVVAVKDYGATKALLRRVVLAERQSDHPLAKAIVKAIDQTTLAFTDQAVSNLTVTKVIKGQGLIAQELVIGNEKLLIEQKILLTEEQKKDLLRLQAQGASTVLVAFEGVLKIIYAIADELRPEAKPALRQFKKLGISQIMMLTGDNEETAKAIAAQLEIDKVQAGLLPEQKVEVLQELQKQGKRVAFIGDGINDAPSLAQADIGIAMGSGTDVAIETSDVVLMTSSFSELVHAYALSKKAVVNMRENIAAAIGVVLFLLMGLVLGGTGLIGQFVTMSTGMFVHEGSILAVIFNAMRLIPFHKK